MRFSNGLVGASAIALIAFSTSAFAGEEAKSGGGNDAAPPPPVAYVDNTSNAAGADTSSDKTAAEISSPASESSTIVVTGVHDPSSVLPTQNPSILGNSASALDTPRSFTQVNADQLSKDIIFNTDDLMKYAPGISAGGGQNAQIAPTIRGQSSEVFQDGQRGYAVRHPANFNAYEGADIVEGQSSVIYGPTAGSGGYINYITKKPNFDEQHTSFSARVGTLVPDGTNRGAYTITADTTGPISDTLAYRVSGTFQRQQDYYLNVNNDYDAIYGALAYKPNSQLRIDANFAYDNYYDWNITHGWNRPSQSEVDDGEYYAGRATPIFKNGSTLWSPVFASGAANSAVLGWVQRARNAQGQYPVVANSFTTTNPNTLASPGSIAGYVYDPTLAGNGLVSLSPQVSQRAADQNTSLRITGQLHVVYDFDPKTSLANHAFFERSTDTTNATGSFFAQTHDDIFEDRSELHHTFDFDIGGLDIVDETNSGLIVRTESNYSLAANDSFFNINAYDLTVDPTYEQDKNPGSLLGLASTNAGGGNGAWIGSAGVPQSSNQFGYLSLPPMYSVGNGFYAESVASYTVASKWTTITLYTDHNLKFGKHFGVDAGYSHSFVHADIHNPFVLPGASDRASSGTFDGLFALQLSPYIKPTENTTLYFTYDHSIAINTGGFSNSLSWGTGALANSLNPLQFDSNSILYEAGFKAQLLQKKLYFTIDYYHQARDLAPDPLQNNAISRLIVHGIDSTLRYEPNQTIRSGLNFSYLKARYGYTSTSGFSTVGFVPDGETVFSDGTPPLNIPSTGSFPAQQLPAYTVTGYIDYRHSSGLGAELSGTFTSPWYLNLSDTVRIPSEYNLDLSLFYRKKRWSFEVAVTNLTNQLNFVPGLTGGANSFLQPSRGREVNAQFGFSF